MQSGAEQPGLFGEQQKLQNMLLLQQARSCAPALLQTTDEAALYAMETGLKLQAD
jgi:hypothetical protein